jgi:hypothetical protein
MVRAPTDKTKVFLETLCAQVKYPKSSVGTFAVIRMIILNFYLYGGIRTRFQNPLLEALGAA